MGVKIKTNFGKRINALAKQHGVQINVAESLIKAYIHSMVEDVTNGEDVVIDGFVSIKVMNGADGEPIIRGRVSEALRQKLRKVQDEKEAMLEDEDEE